MQTDDLKAPISRWNRDDLFRAVAVLYKAKGFVIEESQNLPDPIAFLSRASSDSDELIAVGCISAPGTAAPTTQIQLFWQRMQERQLASGVLVTNGEYDAAALEFAENLPLLLISFDGLASAIAELPEAERTALFPAVVNAFAPAPEAAAPAHPTVQVPFVRTPEPDEAPADVPEPIPAQQAAPAVVVPAFQAPLVRPPEPDFSSPPNSPPAPNQALASSLGAPAGQEMPKQENAAEVKPFPLPAAAVQPLERPEEARPAVPDPKPEAKKVDKPKPVKKPKAAKKPKAPKKPKEPKKPKAPKKPKEPKKPKATKKAKWKSGKSLPIRKLASTAAVLAILGGGGVFLSTSEPIREKLTEFGTTIWNAGPFGDPAGENSPAKPKIQIQVDQPPIEPAEIAEEEPIDLGARQQLLVQRVSLLENLKIRVLGEQRAGEVVTVDRLALGLDIDFVDLARDDLESAVRLMTGEVEKPGLELPEELVSNQHFGRLNQHPAVELTPFLALVDGRIELQSIEIDVDEELAKEVSTGPVDAKAIKESLTRLDRRLYVHGALEGRLRAQSIAGVVGSARAAGVDFVDGKTEIASVILMAVRGAEVDDPDSAFDGVEFRVPVAFTEPRDTILRFLRIRNGRLVYEEELDPAEKIRERFVKIDPANPEQLTEAIKAAEGLIRAANMELLVQRELKLDRLLAPVTGLSPSSGF
ncbi:MAG: hypothetical protein ACI8UO_003192 [Verrucomicrobiales bacterium]|jgi:hypothetical protein